MPTAHEWTDERLLRLERRIKAAYQKAYSECYNEMMSVMSELQDDHGKLPLAKRMGLLYKRKKLENMCRQMADAISNAGKMAESLVNSAVVDVYTHNYNAFAGVLEFSLVTHNDVISILKGKVNPFDHLALAGIQDRNVLKRRMESELTTSLLKGESIPKIAKRLQNAANGNLSVAVRVARTEVTRVEAAARDDIGKRGEELGFDMGKRWIATKDKRTRPSHRAADRQEVRMGELFEVEGNDGTQLMEYPGDVANGAGPENVCNCRCTMIPFIIGIKQGVLDEKTADVALLNEQLSVK